MPHIRTDTYGLFNEFVMVIAWRYFYGSGVLNLKYIDDAYNCRYTFRYANIEVGRTCFVAFWKRSKEWWAFKRMPLYTDECFMDIFGWYLDLSVTSGFWSCPMYHYYWDTFWFAAL